MNRLLLILLAPLVLGAVLFLAGWALVSEGTIPCDEFGCAGFVVLGAAAVASLVSVLGFETPAFAAVPLALIGALATMWFRIGPGRF